MKIGGFLTGKRVWLIILLALVASTTVVYAATQWYQATYFHGTVKTSQSSVTKGEVDFGVMQSNTAFSGINCTATIEVEGGGSLRITGIQMILPKGCGTTTAAAFYNLYFDYKIDNVMKCQNVPIVRDGSFRGGTATWYEWYLTSSNGNDIYEYMDWGPETLTLGTHNMTFIFHGKTGTPTEDKQVNLWLEISLEA